MIGSVSGLLCGHGTNFYRFLRSPAWDVTTVAQQLFWLCLPVCQDHDGRVLVAVDDTLCRKRGTHFERVGVQR